MSKAILNKVKGGDLELKEKVVSINRVLKLPKVVVLLVFLLWLLWVMEAVLLVMVWVRPKKYRKPSQKELKMQKRT